MRTWLANAAFQARRVLSGFLKTSFAVVSLIAVSAGSALAQPAGETANGGEASLKLPDLSSVSFLNGAINGHNLLLIGILFCFFGLGFGMVIYMRLKNLPVHRAMREISELIYETCKTYLVTQGKFILLLWAFIAVVILLYFGLLEHMEAARVAIILAFSLVGIAGSYGVAWFGIRVNTFANSRTAFASLPGKPFPVYQIPLEAGMSIGMMLISVELLIMLIILLFIPGDYAGPCFIGFAIGESLGAAALRIAGGIFTKIADIGSDLMKIVFQDQRRRCPQSRRHRGLHGRQRRRLGWAFRRWVRDLRRNWRRADHVYSARREESHGAGPIAGVDLRDARHDAGGQLSLLFPERNHCQGALWQSG